MTGVAHRQKGGNPRCTSVFDGSCSSTRERKTTKRVTLDTENYRKKREETLVKLANRIAGKVARTGKRVVLEPMNPYERRILHATLQNNPKVETISEGEEPYRRVIIKKKK